MSQPRQPTDAEVGIASGRINVLAAAAIPVICLRMAPTNAANGGLAKTLFLSLVSRANPCTLSFCISQMLETAFQLPYTAPCDFRVPSERSGVWPRCPHDDATRPQHPRQALEAWPALALLIGPAAQVLRLNGQHETSIWWWMASSPYFASLCGDVQGRGCKPCGTSARIVEG